ncbi:MAG: M23 family metallopeptidase [Patescibacteria group bacterium]|jgi:murein DD-endopeptidase MepM/ murein hydrolase activator NlpD
MTSTLAPQKSRLVLTGLIAIVLIGTGILAWKNRAPEDATTDLTVTPPTNQPSVVAENTTPELTKPVENVETTTPQPEQPVVPPDTPRDMTTPITRATERITKKPFGIKIDTATSPVQPERFSGYHSGTDFEAFPEELGTEVTVTAACDGTVLRKQTVNGYGGVFIQSCTIDGQNVTVLYGHMDLASITFKQGNEISQGMAIGNLGDNKSAETDGERKHLHFSIHKGTAIELRGYAQRETDLSAWLNPADYL